MLAPTEPASSSASHLPWVWGPGFLPLELGSGTHRQTQETNSKHTSKHVMFLPTSGLESFEHFWNVLHVRGLLAQTIVHFAHFQVQSCSRISLLASLLAASCSWQVHSSNGALRAQTLLEPSELSGLAG